ncbi:MAG: cellulase family glycosylhydrolase [Dehalococcoidia bacterium]|nr:cellulase family glycosylhydrolase [Dehalococcoidia bacterium]
MVSSATLLSSTSSFSQTGTSIFLPIVQKGYDSNHSIFLPIVQKGYDSNQVLPFGVQIGDLRDSPHIDLAQSVGAGWVRTGLSWASLEPNNVTPENFNWSAYDPGLAAIAQANLQPLINITDNPAWAATTSCGPINSEYLQDYASFLQAVVARYSKAPYNVHYWEIYNEPDNTTPYRIWLGGCWGFKGKQYADMLRVAYPVIKAADPQAQVVLGSLAYDWFTKDGGPFDERFIDDVVDPAAGNGGAYFDILAFHYYTVFANVWDRYGTDVMGKTNYLRSKLASYGVTKPMIVTEISQWSKSSDGSGSDAQQSAYVVQSFARTLAAGLRFSIWYNLVDYSDIGYGLFNADFSHKPSYTAYQVVNRRMSGASYVGPLQIGGIRPNHIEGYTFTMPDQRQRYILWATVDGTVKVAFPGNGAVVTNSAGVATTVTDSADGALDGVVNLSVTNSPVYVDISS